jgi:hypothetical protein
MAVLRNVHTAAKIGVYILLCQLIMLNILSNTVTPQGVASYGGEHWIENNEYDYYPLDMSTGGGTLNYSIRVTTGHRIDIILFDEDNYEAYSNGEPAIYIEEGSAFDRYDVFLTTDLEGGDYYLVIDNTDFGVAAPPPNQEMGGVEIEFEIDYTYSSNPFNDVNWIAIFLVIIFVVIVTILIIFAIILRKDRPKTYQSSQYSPPQETQHNLLEYPTYYPESQHLQCSVCGGNVPFDRDNCPNCGSKVKSE